MRYLLKFSFSSLIIFCLKLLYFVDLYIFYGANLARNDGPWVLLGTFNLMDVIQFPSTGSSFWNYYWPYARIQYHPWSNVFRNGPINSVFLSLILRLLSPEIRSSRRCSPRNTPGMCYRSSRVSVYRPFQRMSNSYSLPWWNMCV